MISLHNNQGEGEKEKEGARTTEKVIGISLASKRHWELQIKTLQDAPRDEKKLRQILESKQKEYEKATDSEHIERLIPEIEMLKVALLLVTHKRKKGRRRRTRKRKRKDTCYYIRWLYFITRMMLGPKGLIILN